MMKTVTTTLSWVLNRHMLLAGLLLCLLVSRIGNVAETVAYSGPYVVFYGEDGEIRREADRTTFLRERLTNEAMFIVLLLFAWIILARHERHKNLIIGANESVLLARIARLTLMNKTILSDLHDPVAGEILSKLSNLSEYISAQKDVSDAEAHYFYYKQNLWHDKRHFQ